MTLAFQADRHHFTLAALAALAILPAALLLGSCGAGKPLEGSLNAAISSVRILPDTVTVPAGKAVQFSAVGTLTDGSRETVSVDWDATGGAISSGGRYVAGNFAGQYVVVATYQGGISDTGVVIVVPSLIGLSVTPGNAAVLPGGSQQFTAAGVASDGSSAPVAVSWSATSGSVDANGLYTAPATAGSALVVAVQESGTLADTARVTVGTPPPTLTAVVLTPTSASLQFGQTRQFTALGQLSDGSQTAVAVTWRATGGTVSASGLYTAGNTGGTFRVTATSANGLADTSGVTISAPTVTSLTLTPATVSLQSGQTQQFSATATLSSGGTQSNPPVTWSVTGGTISAGGLYTAGTTAGTFRVIATAASGVADTSAVTVTAATVTAIVISPASTTILTGQTQQFTVSATLSNGGTQANPSVTWNATGGTITAAGLYTGGGTAGTFRVIAVQQGGTAADTAAITLATPGVFNPYAHRPANYTVVESDYAFNTPIPASDGPVPDGSGWFTIFNSGSMHQGTDPNAPIDPSNVLEWVYPPGAGGSGVGHLYREVSSSVSAWYVSFALWHDPNFEFNDASNKLFGWRTANQDNLLESVHFGSDVFAYQFESIGGVPYYSATTAFGRALSQASLQGHWVNVELLYVVGSSGSIQVWAGRSDGSDGPQGQLVLSQSNINVLPPVELYLNSTWGGGGTRTRTSVRRIDHILIAHP